MDAAIRPIAHSERRDGGGFAAAHREDDAIGELTGPARVADGLNDRLVNAVAGQVTIDHSLNLEIHRILGVGSLVGPAGDLDRRSLLDARRTVGVVAEVDVTDRTLRVTDLPRSGRGTGRAHHEHRQRPTE